MFPHKYVYECIYQGVIKMASNEEQEMKWAMWYKDEDFIPEETACFVYLIQFPNSGEFYIGQKRVWKSIKNISEIKPESKQSNWNDYTSSSKSVNEMIEAGEPYKKSILACFPTYAEALHAESSLICMLCSQWGSLNKALMAKFKFTAGMDKEHMQKIRELLEDLT